MKENNKKEEDNEKEMDNEKEEENEKKEDDQKEGDTKKKEGSNDVCREDQESLGNLARDIANDERKFKS